MSSVFVSGATGFIAQHVVKQLIAKNYKVVGSVRSKEKGEQLVAKFGENFQYEIVSDIGKPGAFDDALKKHPEVTIFLHTASPFHFNVTDIKKELLDPATQGTENALRAIKVYGPQIKKVVVTSSYAAIMNLKTEYNPEVTNTEATWNPGSVEDALQNPIAGYLISKTLAEKAAWDFLEKEHPNFTVTTVNPAYVFGPQAFDSDVKDTLNTSSELINKVLKLKPNEEIPTMAGAFIDVRDVAKAHLIAFENADAEGKRLALVEARFSNHDIARVIRDRFSEVDIPSPDVKKAEAERASLCKLDFSQTRKIFGSKYIDFDTSVYDSVKQILQK
ncbi:putative NADPH-dependent methylglyoxal reductase GRP2 [Meyerozyma sp. JA9]|nr:putative NADPH-dependent methylglyoxal reductase GRP2 [Meyerozyma sp. JA9]